MKLQQPLSAKLGEVKFRQKLILQHQGKKTYFPTHLTAKENLWVLKKRAHLSLKIFKQLQRKGISLSPFLELGGEKCTRAVVLTSKMKAQGAVIDLSAESLQAASYFCYKFGFRQIPLRICADAYHLPFKDNSFNFIFTFQTLHHFPDPFPIVKELYRTLAPGGWFYVDEEPVKQIINLPLWYRDYHLRWWEKLLKFFLILPFISKIGRSEVAQGVLEESFNYAVWEKALNVFDQVQGELIPLLFGPKTSVNKGKSGWLKPKLLPKIIIGLLGGGLKALGQKKGTLSTPKKGLKSLICCPSCHRKIIWQKTKLFCRKCNHLYPVKKGVLYLLEPKLRQKLYS